MKTTFLKSEGTSQVQNKLRETEHGNVEENSVVVEGKKIKELLSKNYFLLK